MLSSQAFTSNGIYVALIYAVMLLPTIVIGYVANWKIFQKMGEPGWKALIPFYGPYIRFKKVWDKNVYWFYLVFSILFYVTFWMMTRPENQGQLLIWGILCGVTYVIQFVLFVIYQLHLSASFNHNSKFALGLIFVRVVFICILGFGRAQYIGIQPIRKKKTENLS